MKITDGTKLVPVKNPQNVDVRNVSEAPDTAAVALTLKPGESPFWYWSGVLTIACS